ncbi:hypothetical protein MKX03_012859 [Papaver bracteatum]|nr:hypothetical protein MKX03_012859 [Papaver bracteatum]
MRGSNKSANGTVDLKENEVDEADGDEYTQDGMVDLKGNPVLRSKRGGWKACSFGMGLLTLTVSLHSLRPPPCYETNVADCKQASTLQLAVFYTALYILAIGTGGTKPNISTIGADQFDEFHPKEKAHKLSFNWWMFSIFFGTLFANTFLVYIQRRIQDFKTGGSQLHTLASRWIRHCLHTRQCRLDSRIWATNNWTRCINHHIFSWYFLLSTQSACRKSFYYG